MCMGREDPTMIPNGTVQGSRMPCIYQAPNHNLSSPFLAVTQYMLCLVILGCGLNIWMCSVDCSIVDGRELKFYRWCITIPCLVLQMV